MNHSLRAVAGFLAGAALFLLAPLTSQGQGVPTIRRVQVLRSGGQLEIEIEASAHLIPQTHLLTGPDRLVVDFVNALPGSQLHSQALNREDVKRLRVGLFSADPPVTRVVLDLNGPQPYQVFPSGKTVIVKVGETGAAKPAAYHPGSAPALVNTNYSAQAVPISAPVPPAAKPALTVSFQDGLLSISSDKASLSEILFAVHQRTGAEIAIPAGAEQEKVAVELGPAPAAEVLAHLLNGSNFNFLILNSSIDPRALDRVILTPRVGGSMPAPSPKVQSVTEEEDEAANQPQVAPPARPVPMGVPPAPPETKPADNEVPN
jgi:hypothetical protein